MTEIFHQPTSPCYRDLRGKVALVTGGGAGIGRAISLRLADEGMHVVLCGRTEARLLKTTQMIEATGGKATPIVTDVSQEESVAQLFARMREDGLALDLLVHNAATLQGRSLQDTDTALWHKIMSTNLDSAFYLAKMASEEMIPRKTGNMVFISTIGAERAHHKMLAYDSSKGALNSFTRGVALEMCQHGIRVNAVAPGATLGRDVEGKPVDAPWVKRNLKAFEAEIPLEDITQQYIPLGRYGTPFEMASVVAFLASDQSSYMIGQILYVDGGATAQLSPRGIFI